MAVLALLGHVGHGKTSLASALSGQPLDRWNDERSGQRTVDLHAISFSLGEDEVQLLDGPGHEKYRRNLVASVNGATGYVFVVAADEGWMPQAQEQLTLLRAFGLTRGIAVITKCDKVSREEANACADEVKVRLETALRVAPRVCRWHRGDAAATASLAQVLANFPVLSHEPAVAHLWVDRTFLPKGRGRVVTGTLRGADFAGPVLWNAGDGRELRIRGMQHAGRSTDCAIQGQRVAFELVGDSEDVARGHLLLAAARTLGTSVVDIVLAEEAPKVRRSQTYWLCVGTTGTPARAVDVAGSLVRLRLSDATPLFPMARVCLQSFGGERIESWGTVVDPAAKGRLRRTVDALPFPAVVPAIWKLRGVLDPQSFAESSLLSSDYWTAAVSEGEFDGSAWYPVGTMARGLAVCAEHEGPTSRKLLERSVEKHLRVDRKVAARLIAHWVTTKALRSTASGLWTEKSYLAEHARYAPKSEQVAASLAQAESSVHGIEDRRALEFLQAEGRVVFLGDGYWIDADREQAHWSTAQTALKRGPCDIAVLRQHVPVARRELVRLLEYWDRVGKTERVGEQRRLTDR